MREFINIVTESQATVPSFVEHVTDDVIEDMIRTGKFVDHGSEISEQWDNGIFDYWTEQVHPELVGKSYEEVRHLPQFREVLHTTMRYVADQQYTRLINGSSDNPPLTPTTLLYRGITTNRGVNGSTGVYWSLNKTQSVHRFINPSVGGLLFVAEVKDVTIDWAATIRSRLDLSNGQDEQEIQLKPGTPVRARVFHVSFQGRTPRLTVGNYAFLKA